MVDEFTKIVPSTFEPFIGHHQRLVVFLKSFESFLVSIM